MTHEGPGGPLLSVWAHPDDETYLCAALMAKAVASGRRVVCVTATRGELGSTDPDRWPPGPSLAEVRTVELEACLAELGVTEHHWLDYPDGGCAAVSDSEGTARIREFVDDLRPSTVLTFGPDGMTGHPDHQAVSRWTAAAVSGTDSAAHAATNTPEWLARYRHPLDELGVFMDAEPPCAPVEELSLHLVAEGELLDRKVAAMLHQISQLEPLVQALGIEFLREGFAEEAFTPLVDQTSRANSAATEIKR